MTLNPSSVALRVLTLNENEHQQSTFYRLKKSWTLRFRLGPSLFGSDVAVHTNHPQNVTEAYCRNKYRILTWRNDSSNRDDDTSIYADIDINTAGPFHYYFTLKNDEKSLGSGYFVVDPELTYGKANEILPLDCVQCQTYLSKCLGCFDGWKDRLLVSKESGYNVIHFTPIQSLGASQSAYCLLDQLCLNPNFNSTEKVYTLDDVKHLTQMMRDEWKVLSMCDIVLNHSANDSAWLHEHPEGSYNLENSPHLRPAYILDRVLWHFSIDISEGKWTSRGIPPKIEQYEQINAVRSTLHGHFLPIVKLAEFYMTNVDEMVNIFQEKITGTIPGMGSSESISLIQDLLYRRFGCSVDMEKSISIYNVHLGNCSEDERIQKCCQTFREKLNELNGEAFHIAQIHLAAAVDNVVAAMNYERLQNGGPQISEVSCKHPLVPKYFHYYGADNCLIEEEKLMFSEENKYIMAHNGWVMGDDPLRNFAESDSNVYLRRELIAWGDSVKLRYGDKPEDCPYLWNHMKKYAEQTAEIFHGIRLDNCHSTPICAAEYMIDAARKIRPDLYVVAELFTSSEGIDNIFVNRLGINSLIRESMSAHDSHEEGRLVYRYGGVPIGSFIQEICRPLTPSIAHALFFDLTHDNPCPIEKRCVYDLLPSAALVSMACCGTGSNFGYDELVPHHIHVVNEERIYPSWSLRNNYDPSLLNSVSGIIKGKKLLNDLHFQLGIEGYNEVFVDQVDADIVTVTRHRSDTHQSVILVAFTAFSHPTNFKEYRYIKPLHISGIVEEIMFEAKLVKTTESKFKKDSQYINGLADYAIEMKQHLPLFESEFVKARNINCGNSIVSQELEFSQFYPGSIIAFRVSLNTESKSEIAKIKSCFADGALDEIISHLGLSQINRVLFRCDNEERDDTKGSECIYAIANVNYVHYAGLQGIMTVLKNIRGNNDLGHPLCDNLRRGYWLLDYIARRLLRNDATMKLSLWFSHVFASMKLIPNYLMPTYFDYVITGVYSRVLNRTWKLMSKFVFEGSVFVRLLALGSVILCGHSLNARLPLFTHQPYVPLSHSSFDGEMVSLSAGLPHFSTDYMRNWGRDTFIALKGLLLITGRYNEARCIILSFGTSLRHGLIPNLLHGTSLCRYNARDAIWFWLHSIQEYTRMVPEGWLILKDSLLRRFPTDEADGQVLKDQLLEDTIYEALQRHVTGVKFREWNAGPNLDEQMTNEGFNNEIGVDPITGFVFGGNIHNCGTWMDKMGSSISAGTKGKPSTPRDGSAVELVGLCRSVLNWLLQMNKEGKFPYNSFTLSHNRTLTIENWINLIDDNFEKCFWIPMDASDAQYDLHPELINSRGIYKDTFNGCESWRDYQFRCNFSVAMAVAPEMFDSDHAWIALQNIEKHLLGPLGMKTLSENDWAYNGYYDNGNNSGDPKVTNGFNYHQGPEWLWPLGFFLRAKLIFARRRGDEQILRNTVHFTKKCFSRHFEELQKSPWCGLPELTNRNGEFCPGSCPIQAWSMGCLLEVLHDINNIVC